MPGRSVRLLGQATTCSSKEKTSARCTFRMSGELPGDSGFGAHTAYSAVFEEDRAYHPALVRLRNKTGLSTSLTAGRAVELRCFRIFVFNTLPTELRDRRLSCEAEGLERSARPCRD